MRPQIIWGTIFLLAGCSAGTGEPEYRGMTADQLVPTLQRIAETGDYKDVQDPLTEGLENEGYMDQAVVVQSFQNFKSPTDIKKIAQHLVKQLQR